MITALLLLVPTLLLLVALLVPVLLVVLLVVLLKISNTLRSHTSFIIAHSDSGHLVIGAEVGVSALVICLFNIW